MLFVPLPHPTHTYAFEFDLFKTQIQQAKQMPLGLPAKGCCLHQALILGWTEGIFLVPRRRGAAGPHLPFFWGDTEGNQSFFWGVAGCLLQNGSLLRVFPSSVPLVASAGERFVDLCTPEPGMRAELGRGESGFCEGPFLSTLSGEAPAQGAQVCLSQTEPEEGYMLTGLW